MKQEFDPQSAKWLLKVGKQVRELREEKSIGYAKFAEEVGMSKNTILKVEKGEHEYYFSTLLKILAYYPDLKFSQFFEKAGL